MKDYTVLITGASSGLGAALAIEYSYRKYNIILCGRKLENLSNIAQRCRKNGSIVILLSVDICEKELIKQYILSVLHITKIDLVILNAAISNGTLDESLRFDEAAYKILNTNIYGVLHVIFPIIKHIVDNKQQCRLVFISSMAGIIPLAKSPFYSGSKNFLIYLSNSFRALLGKYNIEISLVMPGYIDTPMTQANNFYMPWIEKVDLAAKKIVTGIDKERKYIIFPWFFYCIIKLCSFLPSYVLDIINKRIVHKKYLNF